MCRTEPSLRMFLDAVAVPARYPYDEAHGVDREVVTRERVLPETVPTAGALALLASWRDEVEAGYVATAGDVLSRIDFLAENLEALRDETRGLRHALTSRTTIDEAKGVIMARRGCDSDEAFEALVELSQCANVPLRDVARGLVRQVAVS